MFIGHTINDVALKLRLQLDLYRFTEAVGGVAKY